VSHRFHHGPLGPLHTERAFPEPALWAVLTLVAVLLAIGLAGCADPDFRGSMGESAKTAAAVAAPRPNIPTVEVPNPFYCPGHPA
jgi:hypothetical protein